MVKFVKLSTDSLILLNKSKRIILEDCPQLKSLSDDETIKRSLQKFILRGSKNGKRKNL